MLCIGNIILYLVGVWLWNGWSLSSEMVVYFCFWVVSYGESVVYKYKKSRLSLFFYNVNGY